MIDVLGYAISDYYRNTSPGKLFINNKYGAKEKMPLVIYFRNMRNMPEMEIIAMRKCRGKVLDIGAGAGSHALVLQQKGFDVTALEISKKACEVMKDRGILKVVHKDIYLYKKEQFDTLLLLMNGIGFTGTIQRLREFLQHAKSLLKPGGQLLFDSSDIAYLYKNRQPPPDVYYGEVVYQYEYKDQKTAWFKWLYIDRKTLRKVAEEEGWKTKVLFDDGSDQYLARLRLKAEQS